MAQQKAPRPYEPETVTPGQIKQLCGIAALHVPTTLSFRHAERLIKKGRLASLLNKTFEAEIKKFESRPSRFVDVSRVETVQIPAMGGPTAGIPSDLPLRVFFDEVNKLKLRDFDLSRTVEEKGYLHVFDDGVHESDIMQDAEGDMTFSLPQLCAVIVKEKTRGVLTGIRCKLKMHAPGRKVSAWARFTENSLLINRDYGTGVMVQGEGYLFRFPR